eukprot:CAMPEP_0180557310 /NCGR_PEP_ID=MMETSP1037_2-20121125/1083_1 /TAXON_ID=632150 /ORGANISM="Azadinium spinosum, Strain 3D9" /LENGTH=463 /DNA_ID=CAMNT_0022573483 /DNA_START=52 /DNA_END=1443 /DNA_ORIENTATION=+
MLNTTISLLSGLIYILVINADKEAEGFSVTLYEFQAYVVLVITCMYAGSVRSLKYRDQILEDMAKSYDKYTDVIKSRSELLNLARAYGPSAVTKTASAMYSRGYIPYVSAVVRDIYYRMDCVYLMDAFSSSAYTATIVVFALLNIKSTFYGSVQFDTSSFLALLNLFSRIAGSIKKFCVATQTFASGRVDMENLDNFFNQETVILKLAEQQREAFNKLKLHASPSEKDLSANFEQCLRIVLPGGSEVRLGASYLVKSARADVQDSVVSSYMKAINQALPPWCRAVHLHSKLPRCRMDDENLVDNVLAFAEPGRFTRQDVLKVLGFLGLDEGRCESYTSSPTRSSSRFDQHLHKTCSEHVDPFIEKALQLAQAIFSDPDVLILDHFFIDRGITASKWGELFRALLSWQCGGPSALMDTKEAGEALAPWHCRDGGIVRTLLLNLTDAMMHELKEEVAPMKQLLIG